MVTSENWQKLTFFRKFWLIFGQIFTFIWPGHRCSSCTLNSKFRPSGHGSHPMLNNSNWYSSISETSNPNHMLRPPNFFTYYSTTHPTTYCIGLETNPKPQNNAN